MSPSINVTITNNRSLDLTAAFQTRIWIEPQIVALPNLTNRQVGGARLINKCASRTALFRFSHCHHEDGVAGSMQKYITYCKEMSSQIVDEDGAYRIWHEPPVLGEVGYCQEDEICMNGLWRRTGFSAVARCVKKDDFKMIFGDGADSHVALGNRLASMVLSRYDGLTPLGVGSMEAAYAESGPVDPSKSESFEEKPDSACKGCFELSTPKSAPETDNLKIEASLITAGALGGVLWLALSG